MAVPLGLYLSIPFCKAKCSFCNFASDAFPPARMEAYTDRLCAEIADCRSRALQAGLEIPGEADTIFLGGGTPSLLAPAEMRRIFSALRGSFHVLPGSEITVEAAPGQVADELLEALLECGVNRVSLGVQSFVDAEARAVGRTHTAEQCLRELERLRNAGVASLNVDLIAGLPYQTAASWAQSLQTAIESGADHISVYMLEVDEDSRLGRELIGPGVRYGAHAAPGESQVAEYYEQACRTLEGAAVRQYEISNFARAGHASRHNLKYWVRAPYLGFGLDAHSMLTDTDGCAVRFANGDDFDGYLRGDEVLERQRIDRLAAWEETVFLGLRLLEGLRPSALQRQFPHAWVDDLLHRSQDLEKEGLMEVREGSIRLTGRGRILSSSVFGELLATPVS